MSVTSARVNLAARRGIVAIAFAALLAAAGPGTALGAHGEAEAKRAPTAQLVLIHGTILTVDAADSTAQALAIRDGKIGLCVIPP